MHSEATSLCSARASSRFETSWLSMIRVALRRMRSREKLVLGCLCPKMRTVFHMRPILRLMRQKTVGRSEISSPSHWAIITCYCMAISENVAFLTILRIKEGSRSGFGRYRSANFDVKCNWRRYTNPWLSNADTQAAIKERKH